MINFKSKILFFSFIFLLNLALARSRSFVTPRFQVHIIDALPPNSKLILHCQSKDDDLGYKVLHPNEEFSFSFNEKLFGVTLYFCHFWWNGKDIPFDVFNSKIAGQCGVIDPDTLECYWKVQEDGFYFGARRNPPPNYERKHDWNS
ncbi:S-protein homolog 2-like [Nicotiana sylvestris]|uniref:S-protein homolog n=1 Tax=Nicotiana sylvestris TaxID=4096 RepID=A0A1U7VV21_NICSY|nr:PREDICTED: uncharacterized protein LOC104217648 [Nicotiana sylvestris]